MGVRGGHQDRGGGGGGRQHYDHADHNHLQHGVQLAGRNLPHNGRRGHMPAGGAGHILAALGHRHAVLAGVHLHPESPGLGGTPRRNQPRRLPGLALHVPLLGLLQDAAHRTPVCPVPALHRRHHEAAVAAAARGQIPAEDPARV
ncbi:hypothetical protein GWK47_035933 [Chionoecetes opilio]|uniref:Uncharacterized protein n=1 Tax=Chionoecetes opilio TaxID=41210 RepID=A0A8J4YTP5_CHIOP|nr:hypothetical protein GWK47_035933 [Chionoecetes opilio]